jgi:GPI mannosyltransferase 2
MATRSTTATSNIRTLLIYFVGYRVFCAAVLLICAYITPFDASHEIIGTPNTVVSRFISTTIRWDTFHFIEIAQNGYTYEYLYAFFPGIPTILRALSAAFGYGNLSAMLWGCWVLIICCLTLPTLYDLTLLHTGSQELAMLASACSIITTSPPTLLHAPYAEPFFAFFSYKGMSFLHA